MGVSVMEARPAPTRSARVRLLHAQPSTGPTGPPWHFGVALKTCATCKLCLSTDRFHKNRARSDGLHTQCKTCVAETNSKWRSANQKRKNATTAAWRRANPESVRISSVVPNDVYLEMLDSQDGRCAICHSDGGNRRLAVDHCHATGAIRGLLCGQCNTSLGLMKESVERLRSAIDYLQR